LTSREADAHGENAGGLDGWLTAGQDSHSAYTGMTAHHSERQPLRRLAAFAVPPGSHLSGSRPRADDGGKPQKKVIGHATAL
jgi:hypothetical protein